MSSVGDENLRPSPPDMANERFRNAAEVTVEYCRVDEESRDTRTGYRTLTKLKHVHVSSQNSAGPQFDHNTNLIHSP
jgi:hypothetical protein